MIQESLTYINNNENHQFDNLQKNYKTVALIPAYNEEATIETVVKLTEKYVDTVIVCDDGSKDNTSQKISNTGAKLIKHNQSRGKGKALNSLFNEALKYDPDIIITLDADLQHDPTEIPKFITQMIKEKPDIIIGSRFMKDSKTDIPILRFIGSSILNVLQMLLLKAPITDSQSGFRAFSKNAYCIFEQGKETGYGTESEQLFLAVKNGLTISEVPITITYKNLPNTSKKNFFVQGLEICKIIIQLRLNARNGYSRSNKTT